MNYFVINKNDIEDKINNFVIFKNENYNGDKICGLMVDDEHVYEALGNCKFDKNLKVISPTYKQIERTNKYYSNEWVKNIYFQKYTTPEKIIKLKKMGCDFDEWYNKSRKYWLKLKTILHMNNNKEIKCLLLDRNVCDIIYQSNKLGKLYDPKSFFKNNVVTIKKVKDLTVQIQFPHENKINESRNFEFHVEYEKDNWYPLINGTLPDKCEQMGYSLLDKEYKWYELSENICIGYRGPMIMWNDVDLMPKIYLL